MLVKVQANPVSSKPPPPPLFISDWASISLFTKCHKRRDRRFRHQLKEINEAAGSEVAGWSDGRYEDGNEDGCLFYLLTRGSVNVIF